MAKKGSFEGANENIDELLNIDLEGKSEDELTEIQTKITNAFQNASEEEMQALAMVSRKINLALSEIASKRNAEISDETAREEGAEALPDHEQTPEEALEITPSDPEIIEGHLERVDVKPEEVVVTPESVSETTVPTVTKYLSKNTRNKEEANENEDVEIEQIPKENREGVFEKWKKEYQGMKDWKSEGAKKLEKKINKLALVIREDVIETDQKTSEITAETLGESVAEPEKLKPEEKDELNALTEAINDPNLPPQEQEAVRIAIHKNWQTIAKEKIAGISIKDIATGFVTGATLSMAARLTLRTTLGLGGVALGATAGAIVSPLRKILGSELKNQRYYKAEANISSNQAEDILEMVKKKKISKIDAIELLNTKTEEYYRNSFFEQDPKFFEEARKIDDLKRMVIENEDEFNNLKGIDRLNRYLELTTQTKENSFYGNNFNETKEEHDKRWNEIEKLSEEIAVITGRKVTTKQLGKAALVGAIGGAVGYTVAHFIGNLLEGSSDTIEHIATKASKSLTDSAHATGGLHATDSTIIHGDSATKGIGSVKAAELDSAMKSVGATAESVSTHEVGSIGIIHKGSSVTDTIDKMVKEGLVSKEDAHLARNNPLSGSIVGDKFMPIDKGGLSYSGNEIRFIPEHNGIAPRFEIVKAHGYQFGTDKDLYDRYIKLGKEPPEWLKRSIAKGWSESIPKELIDSGNAIPSEVSAEKVTTSVVGSLVKNPDFVPNTSDSIYNPYNHDLGVNPLKSQYDTTANPIFPQGVTWIPTSETITPSDSLSLGEKAMIGLAVLEAGLIGTALYRGAKKMKVQKEVTNESDAVEIEKSERSPEQAQSKELDLDQQESFEENKIPIEEIKETIKKLIGDKAKINKLDLVPTMNGLNIRSEMDTGGFIGIINLVGKIENTKDGIEIIDSNISANPLVKRKILGKLKDFYPTIKKHFEDKYKKPVKKIQIHKGELVITT